MAFVNDVGVALSDPTRMLVLQVAADGASTPSEIAEVTGYSRGTISHHLRKLEKAGLVERRCRGRERLVLVRHDRMRALFRVIDGLVGG